jgi:hypothetical protein
MMYVQDNVDRCAAALLGPGNANSQTIFFSSHPSVVLVILAILHFLVRKMQHSCIIVLTSVTCDIIGCPNATDMYSTMFLRFQTL